MKKLNKFLTYLLLIGLTLFLTINCKKYQGNNSTFQTKYPIITGNVIDVDGNIYPTITIGTQTWMVENLKTTKYRNGDPVTFCNYQYNLGNDSIYGKLYDFHSIQDSRKIAPVGWHVPTYEDWETLRAYIWYDGGGRLKETGTTHWQSPNTGATNETGFNGLPGGIRFSDGKFFYISQQGRWWSSTLENHYPYDRAYSCTIMYNSNSITINYADQNCMMSVRCIKD